GPADRDADGAQKLGEALDEEVRVLEEAQDAEVDDDRRREEQPLPARRFGRLDPAGNEVVGDRRDEDEPEEPPVPEAVEDVAGDEQHDLPRSAPEQDEQAEDRDEEDPERVAVEQHAKRPTQVVLDQLL